VTGYLPPTLDLDAIQGDVLLGLQKNAELFLFFAIADAARFKAVARQYIVGQLTSARSVEMRERIVAERRRAGEPARESWLGINLAFTATGLTRLLGARRPRFDPAFERGADHPQTIALLHDPPPSSWVRGFDPCRIDGVFLVTGPNPAFVTFHGETLCRRLDGAIAPVYSEIGTVRPGRWRGREHFGFADGISQPGIRGVTRLSRPHTAPDQGLPGQALVWPGEFVLGYPTQDPTDATKPGPIAPLPAPWARDGSYMVFRRLEQRVPEFRDFVAARAARFGISAELLAARMVGRWKSGAPLELAPIEDNARFAADPKRNNDFGYAVDPFQRACPYAAHIRKTNPRDDVPGESAAVLTHRIIRAGIPFGPEVTPGEAKTMHSRGLLFVCYQASIGRQFEFLQARWSSNPDFPAGKTRPDSGLPVTPGYDPIIGQAPGQGPRAMDEPVPNYPSGNRRSALDMPRQFVIPTAAAYFFVPSIAALRTVLT
jgi:Dyp-type peroxidase family